MKEKIIAILKNNIRDILVEDELCGSDHPAMTHKFHNEMIGYEAATDEIIALFKAEMPTDKEIEFEALEYEEGELGRSFCDFMAGVEWFRNHMKGNI